MSDITPPPNAKPIEVNGWSLNPHDHYARDARRTDHIIVTAKNVLTVAQTEKLTALKVQFLEDLGQNNFLCRYELPDLTPLRALEFVLQVDVYRNKFKIPAALQSITEDLTTCRIDVLLHEGEFDLEQLAESIIEKAHVKRETLEITGNKIRLEAAVNQLETIAADDRVRIIEEVVTPKLFDNEATAIVCAPVRMPGHSTFRGKDQVIAVVDTGFDLGSTEDCHPAFVDKVKKLISVGRATKNVKTDAERVNDPQGHGTHVCGTIVGQELDTSQGLIGGVAPDASLVVSSLLADNRDLAAVKHVEALFSGPYENHGACIHSNSWGDGVASGGIQRDYGSAAREIDDFVRAHPDALICFSAGNDNDEKQKPSIGSQAAAKNCLTVGASGSTRKVVDPRNGETNAIDKDKMCPDSSRGPTKERRIKPDVVAPGSNIFSAYSRHPDVRYGWRVAGASSRLFPNTQWKALTGTSHSTPLVSGCAAILREILQNKGCPKPPATLLKAVIINGADKLPGIDIEAQGFGRVNLQSSATILNKAPVLSKEVSSNTQLSALGGTLIGAPLKQGQEFAFTMAPAAGSIPNGSQFKITMVYNDLGNGQIQNNLNLAVIDPMTSELKHGGTSEDEIDQQNNVEQVIWDPAPRSPLTVRVRAQKIFPDSEQDFALAWSVGLPLEDTERMTL